MTMNKEGNFDANDLRRTIGGFEPSDVNIETRRVKVVASTNTPIGFGGGWTEILEHTSEAVDLSRFDNPKGPAPFLLSHNRYDASAQIGAVVPGSVEISEGKLRCIVEVGAGDEADRMLQDMQAGIRRQVSIGASINQYETDEENKRILVTGWTPVEVSLVPIGADVNAIIGRNAELMYNGDKRINKMLAKSESPETEREQTMDKTIDNKQLIADAQKAVVNQNREMDTIAKDLPADLYKDIGDLRVKSWDEKDPVAHFAKNVAIRLAEHNSGLQKQIDALKSIPDSEKEDLDSERSEKENNDKAPAHITGKEGFSINRGLLMASDGKMTGREAEVTQELRLISKKENADSKSITLPWQLLGFRALQAQASKGSREAEAIISRAQKEPGQFQKLLSGEHDIELAREAAKDYTQRDQGSTESIGLIHPTLMPELLIPALRPLAEMYSWGIQVTRGLTQNIKIPRVTGSTSMNFLNPNNRTFATESNIVIGDYDVELHTGGVYTQFTRQAIIQAQGIEGLVSQDVLETIAIGTQNAALIGSGAGQEPQGLVGSTGVLSKTIAARTGTGTATETEPTDVELIEAVFEIADEDARINNLRWVMSPNRAGYLASTQKVTGQVEKILDVETMTIGRRPVSIYSELSENQVILFDPSYLGIYFFGTGLDVRRDENVPGGGLDVAVYTDFDVLYRQRKAANILASATT